MGIILDNMKLEVNMEYVCYAVDASPFIVKYSKVGLSIATSINTGILGTQV